MAEAERKADLDTGDTIRDIEEMMARLRDPDQQDDARAETKAKIRTGIAALALRINADIDTSKRLHVGKPTSAWRTAYRNLMNLSTTRNELELKYELLQRLLLLESRQPASVTLPLHVHAPARGFREDGDGEILSRREIVIDTLLPSEGRDGSIAVQLENLRVAVGAHGARARARSSMPPRPWSESRKAWLCLRRAARPVSRGGGARLFGARGRADASALGDGVFCVLHRRRLRR